MKYLTPPFIGRRFHFLLLGGLVLLLSCQSDPIVFNPPGGYEYKTKSFQIDTTNVVSVQGNQHTGHSSILYSGIIPLADNLEDTAIVLIRLLPELLETHDVCNNPDIISKVNISLTSITSLVSDDSSLLIQKDFLNIYLLQPGHISETWDENTVLYHTEINTISNDLNDYTPLNDSLISIDNHSIGIELHDFDHTIIDDWCANGSDIRSTIIILYSPDNSTMDPEDPKYLEIVSSDVNLNSMPKLNLEYQIKEDSIITDKRYSISTVKSSLTNPSYYINNESIDAWGTVYVTNGDNTGDLELEDTLDLESIIITEDSLSITQLNSAISLVEIDIVLNPEIQDSIDIITFWLSNSKAYISAIDLNNDNIETNPGGTENNNVWDEGEIFDDYGTDNCQDSLETGQDSCGTSVSIYNPTGTEGNNKLDEDEGEKWWDWGIDGCPDSLETGLDENPCLEEGSLNPAYLEGMDLNGDNYKLDPHNDNYGSDNLTGTEGNEKWDSGEHFFDWGSDGLHHTLLGYPDADSTEGNNIYDIGEVWRDYGTDGCKDEFESGIESHCLSTENPVYPGTEGNSEFDSALEFEDCGIDNICNGANGDDPNDNYKIDPNNDNYSSDNPTGTEGNFEFDEGEYWFDWGIDGVPDSLEAFESSSMILPELYNTLYAVDVTETVDTIFTPSLLADKVSLWISNVQWRTNDSLTIQVSVQTHIALKGLQFQLNHTTYTSVAIILKTHKSSIPNIGDNKLFEDFTLLARAGNPDSSVLANTIQINYANDWSASIDFDSLGIFLAQEEYILSYHNSNLVMYIDTVKSYIHNDGMLLFLDYADTDSKTIYVDVAPSDSIIIFPVGQILVGYQNGSDGSYEDLKLVTNSSLFNYSTLSILYNPDQPDKNPRLDIMYTQ